MPLTNRCIGCARSALRWKKLTEKCTYFARQVLCMVLRLGCESSNSSLVWKRLQRLPQDLAEWHTVTIDFPFDLFSVNIISCT